MNRIAVYGTLREGFGNHAHFMPTLAPLSTERIDGFNMLTNGGFPSVEPAPMERGNTVLIEVYEVDDETLESIDRLEGYPDFYTKVQIDTSVGRADMYMCPDFGGTGVIDSGDWADGN